MRRHASIFIIARMVRTSRRYLLLAVCTLCAFGMLALQVALRRDWVPFDTLRDAPLVFLHYRFPHAGLWWERFALVYALWTLAAIGCVVFARSIAASLGRRFFFAVLFAQALALTAMAASPLPMDSDQYAYVYYGSLTQRGLNPYGHYAHPLALTRTERRIAAHWDNPPYIDRYGAGWTLANAALLWPFRDFSVETQTRVLRITAALAALACSVLLWLALRGFAWRPTAFMAFALNPPVILSSGNGAHNDVYLLLLGLAAYILAERRRYVLAALALGLSVQTKFAYAPLILPMLAVTFVMTRSWLKTLAAAAAFGATVLALSVPLTLKLSLIDVVLSFNANHPPLYSYFLWRIFYHLGLVHSTQQMFALLFPLFTIACSAAVAWLALRRRREPLLELALFLTILFLPYKIESWYGVMFAPVLLIRRPWSCAAFLGITAGCELMQRRIFMYFDRPYVVCLLLGLAVATGVWFLLKREDLTSPPVAVEAA
jgi:hypothetical protein